MNVEAIAKALRALASALEEPAPKELQNGPGPEEIMRVMEDAAIRAARRRRKHD